MELLRKIGLETYAQAMEYLEPWLEALFYYGEAALLVGLVLAFVGLIGWALVFSFGG